MSVSCEKCERVIERKKEGELGGEGGLESEWKGVVVVRKGRGSKGEG